MNGGIFCAIFENKDDYSGKMYCKKCEWPGDGVVNSGTTTDRSSSNYNDASQSERLDNYYFFTESKSL